MEYYSAIYCYKQQMDGSKKQVIANKEASVHTVWFHLLEGLQEARKYL